MSNKEDVLFVLSKKHKCICIGIETFTSLLKEPRRNIISYITDINLIRTGLYAKIDECKLYCSYIVGDNEFMVSDLENPNSKDIDDWHSFFNFKEYCKNNSIMVLA